MYLLVCQEIIEKKRESFMKTKIGQYDLLESLTVIGLKGDPIEVTLNSSDYGNQDDSLKFIFEFTEDSDDKSSRINYSVKDQNTGVIRMTNFQRFRGGGNTKLTELGIFVNRKLYYNMRVFALDGTGNTMIINFYLGEEVRNG